MCFARNKGPRRCCTRRFFSLMNLWFSHVNAEHEETSVEENYVSLLQNPGNVGAQHIACLFFDIYVLVSSEKNFLTWLNSKVSAKLKHEFDNPRQI